VSAGGLRGRPLAWSEAAAGLGLWSTEWTPDMKLERPDALEHHRLVERICAAQPCLPVRFGTAFASVEAARASLDKRAEALHAALARVSGKSASVAVSLAVLVPTEQAHERKADLARIASGFGDVIAVANGPWPPYTFARVE